MPELQTVGQRIAFARSQNDLQQRDLADLLGMKNTVQISQWEGDRYVPSAPRLEQIAQALGTTTSWLLRGEGEPPGPASGLEARMQRIDKRTVDGDTGWLADRFKPLAQRFKYDMVRVGADNHEIEFISLFLESVEFAVMWYRQADYTPRDRASSRREFVIGLRTMHAWLMMHLEMRGAEVRRLDDEWWSSAEFLAEEDEKPSELPAGAKFEASHTRKAERPSTARRKPAAGE
jgi:transcriptional regulator with XRE-family HTH domain